MSTTFTDEEATALLASSNRRMWARAVLDHRQPVVWQRVVLIVGNVLTFYLATQMHDTPVIVSAMLAVATSLAITASVELWAERRRVDALTVLLAQDERGRRP